MIDRWKPFVNKSGTFFLSGFVGISAFVNRKGTHFLSFKSNFYALNCLQMFDLTFCEVLCPLFTALRLIWEFYDSSDLNVYDPSELHKVLLTFKNKIAMSAGVKFTAPAAVIFVIICCYKLLKHVCSVSLVFKIVLKQHSFFLEKRAPDFVLQSRFLDSSLNKIAEIK